MKKNVAGNVEFTHTRILNCTNKVSLEEYRKYYLRLNVSERVKQERLKINKFLKSILCNVNEAMLDVTSILDIANYCGLKKLQCFGGWIRLRIEVEREERELTMLVSLQRASLYHWTCNVSIEYKFLRV